MSPSPATRRPDRKTVERRLIPARRLCFGLLAVVLLAGGAGFATRYALRVPAETGPPPPTYEIFTGIETHPEIPPADPPPPPEAGRPKIAIIIDDIGYDRRMARRFIDLGIPLTFAVLPRSPHRDSILRIARAEGVEIMVHLPMEPVEYPGISPGPGALYRHMTPEALKRRLIRNLELIPDARGVNNHMGSRLTANRSQMYGILSILKGREVFFIDSRTSLRSVGRSTAKLIGLPFAQRDVFLDHEPDLSTIERQIDQLLRVARRHGEAVGIGHPHRATVEALRRTLPRLRDQAELVPASRIVHPVG